MADLREPGRDSLSRMGQHPAIAPVMRLVTALVSQVRQMATRYLQPLAIHPLRVKQQHLALVKRRFLLPQARVFRCLKDRVPSAFGRAALGDRICNRAARCGDPPIFDRRRRRRNRRAPARYGTRNSHWRCKRVGRARPFRIWEPDRRRCHPLPFADRDDRFAGSARRQAQARRRQGFRKSRARVERSLASVRDRSFGFWIHRI